VQGKHAIYDPIPRNRSTVCSRDRDGLSWRGWAGMQLPHLQSYQRSASRVISTFLTADRILFFNSNPFRSFCASAEQPESLHLLHIPTAKTVRLRSCLDGSFQPVRRCFRCAVCLNGSTAERTTSRAQCIHKIQLDPARWRNASRTSNNFLPSHLTARVSDT
jgi:hypothetical protein